MSGCMTLLVYPVLAAALYYLGSWATITKALWTRYPPRLASFMLCPACSGTWLTALVACVGDALYGWPAFGLHGAVGWFLAGLWGCYVVPLLAFLHIRAMSNLTPEQEQGESP